MATTKAKEKEQKPKVLKINHGDGVDEVFLYTDDPNANYAVYTKPGEYKDPEPEAKQEG